MERAKLESSRVEGRNSRITGSEDPMRKRVISFLLGFRVLDFEFRTSPLAFSNFAIYGRDYILVRASGVKMSMYDDPDNVFKEILAIGRPDSRSRIDQSGLLAPGSLHPPLRHR